MVTVEEIEHVSKLMKIDVDDHSEYLEKVQTMISYFDILDSAGVESEAISMPEIPIEQLRTDEYVPFVEKLIEQGVEIRDTECNWVFIKQNQNGKDLSELLELQRIHHRTNSLPGEEGMWIKLNYEPIIKNHDFNFS